MQGSRRRVAAFVLAGLAGLVAYAVQRARAGARDVPVSRATAGWYVGPTFVERRGWTTDERPAGELDDLTDLASERFDATRVDDEIRRFYERTGEYTMTYRATWHRPFRPGAALASRLTSRIEQLNLPGPSDPGWHRLASRFVGVDESNPAVSGAERPDDGESVGDGDWSAVRAWVRTDARSGDAVFVALYGTSVVDGDRLVNIAAPLPSANVSTILRPENADVRAEGSAEPTGEDGDAIRFTTRDGGAPGLYLRTPVGVVELPMAQEFRVWTAPTGEDWVLGAVHEMSLFGRRFLTVDYRIRRTG